ncbi:MAG: hypothetical protein ACXQTR_05075 [Candidatus Methanospirareceae archaeon]
MDVEALKNFVIIDLYKDLYAEGRMSELVEEEHRIIVPLSKILFQRSIVKTITFVKLQSRFWSNWNAR